MKRDMTRYTILAMALGAVLSACAEKEPAQPAQGPAIELGAGMAVPATVPESAASALAKTGGSRGAVNDGDLFTAAVAGWETSGTPDYATPCTWLSTFTAAAAESQPVTLAPKRYYNGSAEVKTAMKAWTPAGTLGPDGQVSFGGPNDGQTDVMLSGAISGSSEIRPGDLCFSHCLTQIRFRIVAEQTLTVPPTLTSITVHGVQLPAGLDLTADEVTYAPAADFPLRGIEAGKTPFGTEAQSVGAALLLRPFEGNTLTVDVVTSLGFHGSVRATIDADAHFMPGKAYTITLTYTGGDPRSLGATVSVAPWQDAQGGNIDIPM